MKQPPQFQNEQTPKFQRETSQQVLEAYQQSVEALEIKIAYQDDTIEQLNQSVIQQQEKITSLEFSLKKLVEKIKAMPGADMQINDGIELPPHY